MRDFKPLSEVDLARDENLARARELLEAWAAPDAAREAERVKILTFIGAHPRDAHQRSCLEGHLTASGLLLDAKEERALLTHHKKLDRWLQLGGHVDGDANLLAGAVREVQEESGILELEIDPTPIDLDIHTIPARGAEPEHLHLDVRFLLRAAPDSREIVSEESHALGWFTPLELAEIGTDSSVRRLFDLAF